MTSQDDPTVPGNAKPASPADQVFTAFQALSEQDQERVMERLNGEFESLIELDQQLSRAEAAAGLGLPPEPTYVDKYRADIRDPELQAFMNYSYGIFGSAPEVQEATQALPLMPPEPAPGPSPWGLVVIVVAIALSCFAMDRCAAARASQRSAPCPSVAAP